MSYEYDSYEPNWYDAKTNWYDPNDCRTKQAYPYSYSAFFLHGSHRTIKNASSVDTDRFPMWGTEKLAEAKRIVGIDKRWDQTPISKLSKFMTAYLGKPAKVVGVVEQCHMSSGYPLWSIFYKTSN